MNPIKNDPVVTAVVVLLAAAGALLAAFGVHLTDIQVAAVVQFVQDALALAFLVRSQVTPKARQASLTRPVVIKQEQVPS